MIILRQKNYSFRRDYTNLAKLYGKTISKVSNENTIKGLIKHRDMGQNKVGRGFEQLVRKSNNQIKRVNELNFNNPIDRSKFIQKASINRSSRLGKLKDFGDQKLREAFQNSGTRIIG